MLEDTETLEEELARRFGSEVGDIVATLSDDPSISDEDERRDDVRDRVEETGGNALAVYCADKVSKVRELRVLRGPEVRKHV